jgi:hypothetical protein
VPGPGTPPPKLAPFGEFPLSKGTEVHRFCSVKRAANAFNPCRGDPTRFAPLWTTTSVGRICVPTLYIGETYEAAAFETVFRNLPPIPFPRRIYEVDLANQGHGKLVLNRDLRLGPLFHPNLGLIGQTRQSMIDTDATCYAETVQWAAAIHQGFPHLDGLVWTSHQHDGHRSYLLFGDRVSEADLIPVGVIEPIDAGVGRGKIGSFAAQYKIDILPPA